MHIFGFADKDGEPVTVSSFFRENLFGFAGMRGLDRSQVSYISIARACPMDMIVNSTVENLRKTFNNVEEIVQCEDLPSNRIMSVALNQRIIDCIEYGPPGDQLFSMWQCLGKSIRIWQLVDSQIPESDFVPPAALYSFNSAKGMIDTMNNDLYIQENWDVKEVRMQYDVSFVGYCVARLVAEDPELIKLVTIENIAEIIFSAKRSNWKQFVDF